MLWFPCNVVAIQLRSLWNSRMIEQLSPFCCRTAAQFRTVLLVQHFHHRHTVILWTCSLTRCQLGFYNTHFFSYEWFLKYQFIVWTNYMICLLKLKVSASKCMSDSSCRLKSHLNSCWISYHFAESWEFIKKGWALLERRWVNERHISFCFLMNK